MNPSKNTIKRLVRKVERGHVIQRYPDGTAAWKEWQLAMNIEAMTKGRIQLIPSQQDLFFQVFGEEGMKAISQFVNK